MVLMSGVVMVPRGVDDVWAFINDLKALPSWAQNVRRAKWTTPKKDGRGVGAKFNQTQYEGLSEIVYKGEVLESVEKVKRATVVRDGSYEVFVTFELAAVDVEGTEDGVAPVQHTRVTMTVNVPSNTWLQYLFAPLATLISKMTMPNQLNAFATAASAYQRR